MRIGGAGTRWGEGSAVTGQSGAPLWSPAPAPEATAGLHWKLEDIAELPRVRAELRRHMAAAAGPRDPRSADLRDRLVLALDEMASNALRHGEGTVLAAVRTTPTSYLIEVSDQAVASPPVPALNRDPSEGGLGLYLIAELATSHGWYVSGGCKHVWALLPRH
jgi:anti-sigma regulatory factor (Ser/Thr protein kinase)